MGNLYLSFLGTNDYLPCTYFSEDGGEVVGVRFVQEATSRIHCDGWAPDDRIVIFTTEDAHRLNWLDNGHQGRAGLNACLSQCGFSAQVKQIFIPEGKSEDEIWKIFQIVFETIQSQDRIVFDITHAFRSIPMLALVVLVYAKVLRSATIEAIYYGAFETLGSYQQASRLPIDERRVPIFNLGPFVTVMDWTLGIDQFIQSGDAGPICSLAKSKVKPILMATEGRDRTAAAIRDLADKLQAFTEALSTCRGKDLSRLGSELHQKISLCRDASLLPPLVPLLTLLDEGVSNFIGNEVFDGLQAVRWCMDHNLTQQAYTILREVVITHLAERAGVSPKVRSEREAASSALRLLLRKERTSLNEEELTTVGKYVTYLKTIPDFLPHLQRILDARNDINHAGYRGPARKARELRNELFNIVQTVEDFIIQKKGE